MRRANIVVFSVAICLALGGMLALSGCAAVGGTAITPPLPTSPSAPAASLYVWCAAIGAGNGSEWTDAYTDLPSSLVRGATYYVAGSTSCSYGPHTFNDAVSGTSVITIEKATATNSGNVAGWRASFGTAPAQWSTIGSNGASWFIEQDYYNFEGSYGTWPPHAGTFGFLFNAPPSTTGRTGRYIFLATVPAETGQTLSNINLDHVEMNNAPIDTSPSDTITCCGAGPHYDSNGEAFTNIIFENSYVHDINGAQIEDAASNSLIDHVWNARNRYTPTQHNEGMTVRNGALTNVTIRNSVWQDGSGTGGIVLLQPQSITGLYIYNNLFFTSSPTVMDYVPGNDGTGLPAWNYAQGAPLANNAETVPYSNIYVFNNTIYSTSGFSGIQIFPSRNTTSTWSNLNIYNNLWFNSQLVGIQTASGRYSWSGEKEGHNVFVNSQLYHLSPGFTCGVHDDACIASYQASPVRISSISISSAGLVTVNTPHPHGLSIGDPVLVIGSELNGRPCGSDTTYPYPPVTTVVSSTEFQYKLTGVPALSNCARGGSAILIRHPSPMPFVSPFNFNFQISSPTILAGDLNKGINLTSTCTSLGLDCTDPNGNRRPANGTWTVGAYQLPTQ
jgi:hypothetical protein